MGLFNRESKLEKVIKEIENKNSDSHKVFFLFMEKIILSVEHDVKTFVPSIGKKTMSEIDEHAFEQLSKVKTSKEFKELIKDEERKIEINPILNDLNKSRPSKWINESFFAVQQIKSKAKAIRSKEEDSDLIKKIERVFKWN